MARLVVLGAGFAGLWAAIGAARRLDDGEAAEILVIDRNPYHNIRVRNYEVDLSDSADRLPICSIASIRRVPGGAKTFLPRRLPRFRCLRR